MLGLVQAARRFPGGRAIVGLGAAAALAAAGAHVAGAQTLADLPDAAFRPTRGVFLPQAARAGDADATAIELNPGQLGLARHGDFAGVVDLSNGNTALPGRGAAVLMSAPIVDGLGFGAGLQHLFGGGGWRTSGFTKLQLGLGLAGRNFGVGASWGHLWGFPADGVDTFDLGASVRVLGRAAFGVVIEDVNSPRLPGAAESLPRRWVAELAVRPLGTDRLEIAAAALHLGGDAWSRLGSRFRAGWGLGRAWRLFADLELAPRRTELRPSGQGTPGGAADTGAGTDVRLAAGLAVAFDHTTLALAGRRAFVPDGADGGGWGGSLVLHESVARNVPAAGPLTVVRLKLHHLDSDRTFLARVLRLRALAGDPTVAAVLLEIEDLGLGVGRVEELRDLVTALRARGKRVVAYVTYPSTRDMYLAVASDRVVIHPAGVATFSGLAQTVTFYKEAMDHLGVRMDLIRIAEFKGAMEPFVMTGQSEAVKRNRNDLLDDLHARIAAAVERARGLGGAAARGVAPAAISPTMESLLARATFTPAEAKEAGLVDAILDDHEVEAYLRTLVGRPGIHIEEAPDATPGRPRRWPGGRVAVILVDGTLVDGPSQDLPFGLGDTVGSDTLVAALEECRRDTSVHAIVLRVNSPGGSAFASDVVARAIIRLRAAGKPVVASMGDVAASGGYYISAPADAIFAEPSTTTGSIGIFGYKLDVAGLMSSLSLRTEVYRRGSHADAASPYRPWTPDERASAERKIRYLYGAFLQTVAAGRKRKGLDVLRVDQLGRGHVYTAAQARTLDLVDELGGVTAAIDRAVTLGHISVDRDESPDLLILPRPTTSLLKLATGLAETVAQIDLATGGATEAPALSPPLRTAGRLLAPYLFGPGEGVEARLPYDLETR